MPVWHKHGVPVPARSRRVPPPLDAAALERLALRYVERFATTRGKLAAYLARKIRERGWEGPEADVDRLVGRFAELGYVDDRGWAEGRAAAMGRRGFGARRVAAELGRAGVGEEDGADALEQARQDALDSALRLARRRRIGPFADAPPDQRLRERQLAALLRAGHGLTLARRIVDAAPGSSLEND